MAKKKVRKRYASVPLSKKFVKQAADFLVYVDYQGTEYYEVFSLIKAFGEEELVTDEGKQLEFIGVDGFRKLINKGKYLEVLDGIVKSEHPDFVPPERKLSDFELELKKKYEGMATELKTDIEDLHKMVSKAKEEEKKHSEDLEKLRKEGEGKESELKAQIASVEKELEEVKLKKTEIDERMKHLQAELDAKKEKINEVINVENEKRNITIEEKDAEIFKVKSEVHSSKKQVLKLETKLSSLKAKHDEAIRKLNSRRREGKEVTLHEAELMIKEQNIAAQVAELVEKEKQLTALEAE